MLTGERLLVLGVLVGPKPGTSESRLNSIAHGTARCIDAWPDSDTPHACVEMVVRDNGGCEELKLGEGGSREGEGGGDPLGVQVGAGLLRNWGMSGGRHWGDGGLVQKIRRPGEEAERSPVG
jgi:hypothetical protein